MGRRIATGVRAPRPNTSRGLIEAVDRVAMPKDRTKSRYRHAQ